MYAREVEFFHYDFDRINFAKILETAPEGEYRADIQKRHDTTLQMMAMVKGIYAALESQITDREAHESAVKRTAEKRTNKQN